MAEIGFIGMGNMGYAILKGALNAFPVESFVFTAKTDRTRHRVHRETDVAYVESNAECAKACKDVVRAVKPQ